ncbi:MAG: hypothetical protein ABI180_11685 [Microcoleus sp.]
MRSLLKGDRLTKQNNSSILQLFNSSIPDVRSPQKPLSCEIKVALLEEEAAGVARKSSCTPSASPKAFGSS